MLNRVEPNVGQWYTRDGQDEMFQVVAVDPENGCIEIQSFDGAIEEIDRDVWMEMEIEVAEAPEDWTGPYDDLERDDVGLVETGPLAPDWRRLVESMEAANELWADAEALE